MYKKDFTTDIE